MGAKKEVESSRSRFERYEKAQGQMALWKDILEETYQYCIPNRSEFDFVTAGEQRTDVVFDSTAVLGTQNFAGNVQSILMPPFRRWAKLVPGEEIPENQKDVVERQLQVVTEILFKFLDQSNFAQVIHESLQDLAIGTGIIVINEGDKNQPFKFMSVPISHVAFEAGEDEKLENFWRRWELPARQIMRLWPSAKPSPELSDRIAKNPNTIVRLVEGTIFYPDNEKNSQYYYYIQEESGKNDIIGEWRSFSPWIGFRFSTAPDEIVGRGPAMNVLPTTKSLNKIQEFVLRSMKFVAFPAFTAPNTSVFNPANMVIEPGSIIPVEPQFVGGNPIQQIAAGGQLQVAFEQILAMQNVIKQALFADPLGPPGQTPNATATEVSIRQENWIRSSSANIGRLTVELLNPIIVKSVEILRKKGLIPNIQIDGKQTSIVYESPILDIQGADDVRRAQQWLQGLQIVLGPNAAGALNLDQYPPWLAEKMNVDLKLVKSADQIQSMIEQISQAAAQQQQAALPAAAPAAAPSIPPFMAQGSPQ